MSSYQVPVGERARRCKNGEEREKEKDTGKRGQPTNGSFTEWHNREMDIRVNGISHSDVKLLLRLVYKLCRSLLFSVGCSTMETLHNIERRHVPKTMLT
jgi:hypothetical protein